VRPHFAAGLKPVLGFLAACALAACTGSNGNLTETKLEIPQGYTVGGTVSGLTGSGLALQNNSGDTLAVAANGAFTFHSVLFSGNTYNVTVSVQPGTPAQTCVVGQGIGTVASANVTNITVTCANKAGPLDNIGGTVHGVSGVGLVLQNDGADDLAVSNGPFTFATALAAGMPYNVTVRSPPINPYQDCTVANGSGTTAGSDVNNVSVSCTTNSNPAHTVGGTISGLSAAKGTIVIQNNGRDDLTIAADGAFTFAMPIPSGSFYNVTSKSLQGPESFTCAFTGGSGQVGNSNVTTVSIVCATSAPVVLTPISVNVAGLAGSGLVLQDNGADNLNVTANGISTFPTALTVGSGYNVSVLAQPTNLSQSCFLGEGEGIGTVVAGTPVLVDIFCNTNSFNVGGTVTGSGGAPFTLQDNGTDTLPVQGDGPFQFPTQVLSGGAYDITVATQPPGLTCLVTNGSGTVGAADVSNVAVVCSPNTYTVGGTVSGLSGTGLTLQDNGGAPLAIGANGAFVFPGSLAGGAPYNVTVLTQPTNPTQNCTVTNGSGNIGAANITNVTITCTTSTFTVGGTVVGNNISNLSLQNNGGAPLAVDGAGAFTFPTPVASGAPYAVTVATQPSNPSQTCTVTNGSGIIGAANVTNVTVTCILGATNQWTWTSGLSTTVTAGVYGTLGTPAVGNIPGTRDYSVTFVDKGGLLWLFGGNGYGNTTAGGSYYLNDLWQYNQQANLWTWMGGPQTEGGSGVYGSLGVAAATNIPGSRYGSGHWTDATGNFWLFGGNGLDSTGGGFALSDLWTYNPTSGFWTWINGPKLANSLGVYGTQGQPAAANVPGSRYLTSSWTDAAGNFWIFGGFGFATAVGANDYLNDLWMYSPATGQWTWVTGTNGLQGAAQYGTQGVAAAGNTPGARSSAVTWTDSSGNLWLFGGQSRIPASGNPIYFNDLWEFSPSTLLWTWVGGSNTTGQPGVYGTQGTAAAANIPGARAEAVSFLDRHGNFWLFGGYGLSSSAICCGALNDMWEYSPATGLWTWMNGANVANTFGTYGTLGVPDPTTTPGARRGAFSWDDAGDFFMQGGSGYGATTNGLLNDLWEYDTGP
jgi:hypothetical protein